MRELVSICDPKPVPAFDAADLVGDFASYDLNRISLARTASPTLVSNPRQCEPIQQKIRSSAAEGRHSAPPLPPEIAFLADYIMRRDVLAAVAERAKKLNVSADAVLLAENYLPEQQFYAALARHLGVPYIDRPVRLDRRTRFPDTIHAGLAAIAGEADFTHLAAPRGAAVGRLIALCRDCEDNRNRPVFAITTPTHLSRLVRAREHENIASLASSGLSCADETLSARSGLTRAQAAVLALAYIAWVASSAVAPQSACLLMSLILALSFLAAILTRLVATAAAIGAPTPERRYVADTDLPVYSIVVAMYREARVAGRLVAALDRLDYPRAKLEIKIVVEAGDRETIEVLRAHCRPPRYEIIVAPRGWPRTKPRALNVALPLLRGEFTAVFDAEDEPDRGQIRMAVERFAAAPATLACVQAKLAIDNGGDGWLQRLFALEYAGLFDVLNVGFADLGWPFPLGGSSNHFRTSALREVMGWDAWNVTEDADIGIRLARFGYRMEGLDSATDEEAPAHLSGWFRQRRRWFKGWYQTAVTLTRDPARLVRELGWTGFAKLWAIGAGWVLAPLAWPFATALLIWRLSVQGWPQPADAGGLVFATLWVFIALAGLPALLWPVLLGMKRRRLMDFWPALPLLLPYQILLTAAAWAAVYDLLIQPHHWFKTDHGFAQSSRRHRAVKG